MDAINAQVKMKLTMYPKMMTLRSGAWLRGGVNASTGRVPGINSGCVIGAAQLALRNANTQTNIATTSPDKTTTLTRDFTARPLSSQSNSETGSRRFSRI